jgi:hypothetical protein
MINHKFNDDFKSHVNLGGTQEELVVLLKHPSFLNSKPLKKKKKRIKKLKIKT